MKKPDDVGALMKQLELENGYIFDQPLNNIESDYEEKE